MTITKGPSELWFLRHGQSEGNVVRDAAERQGEEAYDLDGRDADVPLSALGRRQARAVGRWIATAATEPAADGGYAGPTAVVSSPYVRALDTAREVVEAMGRPLPLRIDERLRDRELGVLSGLTWRGIRARHPQEAERAVLLGRYYHRPPGGESWADMLLRIRSALGDLTEEDPQARVLVVAHDVVVQLVRALLDGLDEAATVALVTGNPYANCALSVYSRNGSAGYELVRWNWTEPLEAENAPATQEDDAHGR